MIVCNLTTCKHVADLERELAEARTALCHALNYCESTDGTKGPLMGSAIPDGVWQRLHAIAAGHARVQP